MITLASGAKMGKTESGAIWLNKDLFSSYEYWQFWRNTDDRDVQKFLNFFNEIKTSEIDEMCRSEKNINKLKVLLANEATRILHGEKSSKKAEMTARETFEGSGISKNLPEIKLDLDEIKLGVNILDLLTKSNIMQSKSEARRAILNKGLKINDKTINNEKLIINLNDF